MGVVNLWVGLASSLHLLVRSRPLVASFRRNFSSMATPEGGVSQSSLGDLSKEDKEQFSDEEHVPSNSTPLASHFMIREKVLKDLQQRSFAGTPFGEHSKNAQRKLIRIHTSKYLKRQRMHQKKEPSDKAIMKDQPSLETEFSSKETDFFLRRDMKRERAKRLEEARLSGQKLAIDCSMEGLMSPKQLGSAARQFKRLYAINARHSTTKPFHIHLTGLLEEGKLRQALREQFPGFDRVIPDISSKRHEEYFPKDSIVYLSPDSPNTLDHLDPTKVYVIGGLVDSNVVSSVTYTAASDCGISTARLPIDDTIIKKNPSGFVLTIDQVFGLLLEVGQGKSWAEAFDSFLPKRKRC